MDLKDNSFGKSNTIQAFWVGLGSLSSFALAIISAAILSRYFEKEEYGTYRQIVYVYSTLLVIFTAGLPRVFGYFLPRYSIEEGKTIVSKITKLLFFAGMLFSLFLFSFSGLIADLLNNKELSYGLKIFAPIPMFLLPTLGLGGIFATYKITIYTAIYNTLSRLIMLLSIVAPVIFFDGSHKHAIYGWVVASILTFFVAYYFQSIPFKNIVRNETNLKYKEIFSYSIPLVVASLWGIAIKSSDQFYISRYFGSEVFAEFSNGFIELPFVTMVTASASAILMPLFSKIIHENNGKDELLRVWKSVLLKSAYIIYPIVIFCMFNATEIVSLIYSDAYVGSAVYFQMRMFLNFFNIVVFAPLIFAMGETKFYAYTHAFIAMIIWFGGWVIVNYFKSPIIIASYSVALSIVNIFIFIFFISYKLKIKVSSFFPLRKMVIMIFHNILILYFLTKLFDVFRMDYNIKLLLLFLLYFSILCFTGKFLKLNYLEVLSPIINKIKKNVTKI